LEFLDTKKVEAETVCNHIRKHVYEWDIAVVGLNKQTQTAGGLISQTERIIHPPALRDAPNNHPVLLVNIPAPWFAYVLCFI